MEANDMLASAISACFASQQGVSEGAAKALQDRLPCITFLRVSLRCGSGLFISGDLLRPGAITVSLVNLHSSMAGLAMKQGTPVSVALDPARAAAWPPKANSTRLVMCYPVGVRPLAASGAEQGISFIGAVQVGLGGPLPERAHSELQGLCSSLGPYLLLVSLTKVQDMAKSMRLPVGECVCCSGEPEEVDDAPFGRCLDDMGPGGPPGAQPPAQAIATASPGPAAEEGAPASPRPAAPPPATLRYRGVTLEGQGGPSSPHKHSPYEAAASKGGWAGLTAQGGASLKEEVLFEGGLGQEEGEEEEDPKAVAKRLASASLVPGGLRQGVLLNFVDAGVEARFRLEQARSMAKLDLLFHAVYLVALACAAALDPAAVLGVATNVWFAWLVALPVAAIASATEWYLRWRTWLLVPLTLLHMAHYRFTAGPALLRTLPAKALHKMPWLLRCTGGEALLVFPLGNKLPFSTFLPLQLAGTLLMLTMLPAPCQALAPLLGGGTGACMPGEWGLRGGAVLVGAGFVLPTCALYFAESRARAQFAGALQAVRGLESRT